MPISVLVCTMVLGLGLSATAWADTPRDGDPRIPDALPAPATESEVFDVPRPDAPSLRPESTPPAPAWTEGNALLPQPAGLAAPDRPLTPRAMFAAAHPVVQAVMAVLAGAILVTGTVLIFKAMEIVLARRRLSRSVATIRGAESLGAAARRLSGRLDPAAFMATASFEEYLRSDEALSLAGPEGLRQRVRSIVERTEAQAAARLRRGLGLLATIASTAPFVGLFGTVWGIMNAFVGISDSGTTNLAVVAPGIAEALLATAMGLLAAIPAVVLYNHFVRATASWRLALSDADAAVERLMSRDLDLRVAGRAER
ncbi:outer membrane transport energization protein ExbB [Rhodovulum steppense]|uniref:Biopolymer transport protein ExbB n=2 Tax=Rhodovulum steppense TaxID=540251 RepID=A0A4R1YSV4_9RHOB|nr:outer membrane transport energization protein ExbB [Rhodovulum steppense]